MNDLLEKLVSDLAAKVTANLEASLEAKLEAKLSVLKELFNERQTIKEHYTCHEIASRIGKKPDTVREWCRTGRIECIKLRGTGRGGEEEWRVPHSGLEHYLNKGLIPVDRRQPVRI